MKKLKKIASKIFGSTKKTAPAEPEADKPYRSPHNERTAASMVVGHPVTLIWKGNPHNAFISAVHDDESIDLTTFESGILFTNVYYLGHKKADPLIAYTPNP